MADAKALFTVKAKEFAEMVEKYSEIAETNPDEVAKNMMPLYVACVTASAITNSRDAICQSIDALTAAIKDSVQ